MVFASTDGYVDGVAKCFPYVWWQLIRAFSGMAAFSGGIDAYHEVKNMCNAAARGKTVSPYDGRVRVVLSLLGGSVCYSRQLSPGPLPALGE